jgi:hypothetical protein
MWRRHYPVRSDPLSSLVAELIKELRLDGSAPMSTRTDLVRRTHLPFFMHCFLVELSIEIPMQGRVGIN